MSLPSRGCCPRSTCGPTSFSMWRTENSLPWSAIIALLAFCAFSSDESCCCYPQNKLAALPQVAELIVKHKMFAPAALNARMVPSCSVSFAS